MPEEARSVGTLDQLKEYMFDVIASIGDAFQNPDDDWLMVGAFEDHNGQMHLGMMPNEAFRNDATKDALAALLKDYITKKGIVNYAILFNVHARRASSKEDGERMLSRHERGQRVSEMDGSFEMLMLVTGCAGAEVVYQNVIERDGEHPPKLSEWEVVEAEKFEGRFAGFSEAIRPIEI